MSSKDGRMGVNTVNYINWYTTKVLILNPKIQKNFIIRAAYYS